MRAGVAPVVPPAFIVIGALVVVLLFLSGGADSQPPDRFDTLFIDRTMRVDYYHSGGRDTETIRLDRVRADGVWAGSRTRLLDDLNLGSYFFEVVDQRTCDVIYSRGFSSIYSEWATTAESHVEHREFHESLRFPWPRQPVQVVLRKRGAGDTFDQIWSTTIDPASRVVNDADPARIGDVWPIIEHGPPATKVDLVVLAEGYTEAQRSKFHQDARRLVAALFREEPFQSRRSDFNVWGLDVAADQPGVTRPRAGEFRQTPLSVEYDVLNMDRYVLTYDNRALRDAASAAPYEHLAILVNEAHYGGGGVFNSQATAAVDASGAEYVFIHELGHHFAGLADEYYASDVPYTARQTDGSEPWEPNVTALRDPGRLKWGDLVQPETPVPTPVTHAGLVGAFEGASYQPTGLFRPEIDCIMFSHNPVGFCRVCQRAISRIIDLYTRP